MKKNILELFLDKISNMPLWIRQLIYLKLAKQMKENCCESINEDIFSNFVPTLTFAGQNELDEKKCGLDNNIYNFLKCCREGYSILEIAINYFFSLEETAKYFEFCLEQRFVENPESKELNAMAGFIAGKIRTGEYFLELGKINEEQLGKAVLLINGTKKFGEILTDLGYITSEEFKAAGILKDEAAKRFIIDCNSVPEINLEYCSSNRKYENEIALLKEENSKLKRKMQQLLKLVRENG